MEYNVEITSKMVAINRGLPLVCQQTATLLAQIVKGKDVNK
jgi:hypothetical protein